LWYAAIGDHDVSIALKALEAFLADEGQCKDRFDPSTPTRVRRELAAFGALLAVDVEPELCGELSDKVLRWGSIKGRHPFETWAPEFQARLARAALSDSSSDLEAAVNCARAFIGGLHPADRSAAAAQIVAESRIYAGSRSSGRVALTLDRLASRLKG
jgi:hypothetical protein